MMMNHKKMVFLLGCISNPCKILGSHDLFYFKIKSSIDRIELGLPIKSNKLVMYQGDSSNIIGLMDSYTC